MSRFVTLALIVLCPIAHAQQAAMHDDERAIEQLKAIVEAIKACPAVSVPDKFGTSSWSQALNTIWDETQRQSERSGKIGYIEFIIRTGYSGKPLQDCKRRDSQCQRDREIAREFVSVMSKGNDDDQYRYEFDLDSDGLEFTRALAKNEKEDATHWRTSTLSGCEGGTVTAALKRPRVQIPENLWNAAKQGQASAMLSIGLLYEDTKATSNDYVDAMHWYRRAAEMGDPEAQFYVGTMYIEGQGVPKDYPQALSWLHRSAEQSDANAEYSLGYAYYSGEGAEVSLPEAFFWFSLAASGSSEAGAADWASKRRDEIKLKLNDQQLQEVESRIVQWNYAHRRITGE